MQTTNHRSQSWIITVAACVLVAVPLLCIVVMGGT
jgi:hypothetical protein